MFIAGQPRVQGTQDLLGFRAVPALHPDQRVLQQLIHLHPVLFNTTILWGLCILILSGPEVMIGFLWWADWF